MTSIPLSLQLILATYRICITARGDIDATTGHLLPKVVVGTLRRYPTACLDIDLSEVSNMDTVGICAILHSQREAERRGILFQLTGVPHRLATLLRSHGAADLVAHLPEPTHRHTYRLPLRHPHTGTCCPTVWLRH